MSPNEPHEKYSRGILSDKLRQKLRDGETNGNDRFRMRKYIENTLLVDFGLLADLDNLDYRDRERIFSKKAEPDESSPTINQPNPDILDGVADAIEFLFLGLARRGEDWDIEDGEHHIQAFDKQLERALVGAYEKHKVPIEGVDLRIRTERNRDMGPVETATLIEHMDPLPEWAIEHANRQGWIDENDLREFVVDQIRTNAGD